MDVYPFTRVCRCDPSGRKVPSFWTVLFSWITSRLYSRSLPFGDQSSICSHARLSVRRVRSEPSDRSVYSSESPARRNHAHRKLVADRRPDGPDQVARWQGDVMPTGPVRMHESERLQTGVPDTVEPRDPPSVRREPGGRVVSDPGRQLPPIGPVASHHPDVARPLSDLIGKEPTIRRPPAGRFLDVRRVREANERISRERRDPQVAVTLVGVGEVQGDPSGHEQPMRLAGERRGGGRGGDRIKRRDPRQRRGQDPAAVHARRISPPVKPTRADRALGSC